MEANLLRTVGTGAHLVRTLRKTRLSRRRSHSNSEERRTARHSVCGAHPTLPAHINDSQYTGGKALIQFNAGSANAAAFHEYYRAIQMQQPLSRRTLLKLLSAAPAVQGLTSLTAENSLQDAIAKTTNYRGGVLTLNLPGDGKDWLPSNLMTFALRFRTSSQAGTGALAVLRDSSQHMLFALNLEQVEGATQVQFLLHTDQSEVPLRMGVPNELIGSARWHTVIARYAGPKIDLFVDGVLLDEEWPMGLLHPQGPAVLEIGSGAYSGEISMAALWKRRLSDAEVISLSGSPTEIAAKTAEYLGASLNQLQYWKPQGWNTSAGDAMPMFDGETFHVYFLFDRRHHKSKWGLGAHQWAHVASTDLIHWKQYPMALGITDESEGSICTGSVFCNNGKYYAFYATRKADRSEQLGVAISDDGIHFTKVLPTPFAEPQSPYRRGTNRDPFVFLDHTSGQYKMLVTAELGDPPLFHRGGALELLQSPDLKVWNPEPPFLVPDYASAQPECSDWFEWNDWYYLSFGQDGATRYRMSRSADGPWLTPAQDLLDDPQARVMKTAPFKKNRRIAAGFVAEQGFGGHLIFRELVQNQDGTLGTKFPDEMSLAAGDPIIRQAKPIAERTAVHDQSLTIRSVSGLGVIAMDEIPQNVKLVLVVRASSTTTAYGVTLRGTGHYQSGVELRLEPFRQRVSWRTAIAKPFDDDPLASIHQVAGLHQRISLEVVAIGSIFDVCINSQRTAIHRATGLHGDRLFLFVADGELMVESFQIRSLL